MQIAKHQAQKIIAKADRVEKQAKHVEHHHARNEKVRNAHKKQHKQVHHSLSQRLNLAEAE
jgi:hypothetical protein